MVNREIMMKLLKEISIISIVCLVLYIVGAWLLTFTEYSYRAWIDFAGKIMMIWGLPLLGIVWLEVCVRRIEMIKRGLRVLLLVVMLCGYLYWAYLGFLGLLFTMDEERMLTSNLIVTRQGGFLDLPHDTYYKPAAVLFKVPCEITLKDKKEFLEEKYNREFEIKRDSIYSIDIPGVKVTVRLNGMEFEDDFIESVLAEYLSCGMEELSIQREYYVAEGIGNKTGIFYMQLKTEDDISDFAEHASKLTAYVCEKTDLFEEYRGYFYFYCGEGDRILKGVIPFGKLGKWDEVDADYYLNPDKLEDYIQKKYEESAEYQKKQKKAQKKIKKAKKEAETVLDKDEVFVDTRETNAKIIYDAALAMQGYSYEVCYNAKGNLYLNLGSRAAGKPEDKSDTGIYRFTLVYDRISQNGQCELFVLYKEHYIENGDGTTTNDTTEILDMYAVKVSNGKVVSADKQSWDDIGTEEYKELTGE